VRDRGRTDHAAVQHAGQREVLDVHVRPVHLPGRSGLSSGLADCRVPCRGGEGAMGSTLSENRRSPNQRADADAGPACSGPSTALGAGRTTPS